MARFSPDFSSAFPLLPNLGLVHSQLHRLYNASGTSPAWVSVVSSAVRKKQRNAAASHMRVLLPVLPLPSPVIFRELTKPCTWRDSGKLSKVGKHLKFYHSF